MADSNLVVNDSNGTRLVDGGRVTVAKELDVNGTNLTLKRCKLFKGLRLTDTDGEGE